MSLNRGTRLGPYEILGLLGAGGMSEVYRARDPRIGRQVAIKILPAAVAADPDKSRRFEQEIHAIGALNHPNILTIHDTGVLAADVPFPGAPFIVTELQAGRTLREAIASGPLAPQRARLCDPDRARSLGRAYCGGRSSRRQAGEPVSDAGRARQDS